MNYSQRFGYNYQIPFEPLYEKVRRDLENGVILLQEKIRKKQIQLQRLYTENLERATKLEYSYHYNKALQQITERQNLNHALSHQQINTSTFGKYSRTHEKLKTEINRNSMLDETSGNKLWSDIKPTLPHQSQQIHSRNMVSMASQTIEQNSTEKEAQKLEGQKNQQDNDHTADNFRTYRAPSQKENENFELYETPYHIIMDRSTNSKLKENKMAEIKQEPSMQNKLHKQFIRTEYTPTKTQHIPTLSNDPCSSLQSDTNNYLRVRSSTGLHSNKRGLQTSLKKHLRTENHSSHLSRSTSKMKSIKESALKKIKNRIKVSNTVYEDVQFRNKKYENTHLFNTFSFEEQARKQVIKKMCTKPFGKKSQIK